MQISFSKFWYSLFIYDNIDNVNNIIDKSYK